MQPQYYQSSVPWKGQMHVIIRCQILKGCWWLENIYLIPPCFNLHAVSRPFQIAQHKMGGNKECEAENLIHNRIRPNHTKSQMMKVSESRTFEQKDMILWYFHLFRVATWNWRKRILKYKSSFYIDYKHFQLKQSKVVCIPFVYLYL